MFGLIRCFKVQTRDTVVIQTEYKHKSSQLDLSFIFTGDTFLLNVRILQEMIAWQVQALFHETNRKCSHLKWLLNLQSLRVHKTNCLSEMSFSWSRSCTGEWVNTICHPSHYIKAQVNNEGKIGRPPACTQGSKVHLWNRSALLYLFCTHKQHRYTHWSHSHASKGVHSSVDANDTERFLPACTKKNKRASRQGDTRIQKNTCIQIWGHGDKAQTLTNTHRHTSPPMNYALCSSLCLDT